MKCFVSLTVTSRLAIRYSSVLSRTITVTFAESTSAGNDQICEVKPRLPDASGCAK